MGSSGSSAGSLRRFTQSSRTGFRGADCCADAVIGKVAAAPPRRAMNSRLFIVASPSVAGFSLVPRCRKAQWLLRPRGFGCSESYTLRRCSERVVADVAVIPIGATAVLLRSRDPSAVGFPTLRSKVRLACLWDGNKALTEMIAIVLGTNHFMKRDFCRALVTPVALTCTPGHREGAGVLHADIDL